MIPVTPEQPPGTEIVVFAKDQPEYQPLPAAVDNCGTLTTEWTLTEEERERIFMGGHLKITLHFTKVHLGEPLTPISIEVLEPECSMDGHAR